MVDSELGKQQVIESYGVVGSRIKVLPFIAPPHDASAVTALDLDARYSLPAKFFFYPAQFWKHKNHKRFVRAVAKVKASCQDIHVVLVGSKKNGYDSVCRLVDELDLAGNISFLGVCA